MESEELYAFEAGYRVSPVDTVSLDFTAFVNVYDNLRTYSARTPGLEADPPPLHVSVPYYASNDASGTSRGFELAARWDAAPWWRLDAAYSFLDLDLQDRGAAGAIDEVQGSSPNHQFSLRSRMDLGDGWELDLWPRYVGELKSLDIDEYVTLDARLGWRPTDNIEFSLVGQNLLDSARQEFVPELVQFSPTKAQRGVYGRLTLTF